MVYLIGAIIFSSLFSIIFKLCQRKEIEGSQVILFNYITAIIVAWVPIGVRLLSGAAAPSDYSLSAGSCGFALLQGCLFVLGFSIMDRSIWRSGVALTTVCARASLIMPVIFSWMFLSQSAPRWLPVGIVLASMALILIPAENAGHNPALLSGKTDKQRRRLAIIDLAAVFLCYGVSDFTMKLSQDSVAAAFSGTASAGTVPETHLDALMGCIFLTAGIVAALSGIVRGTFRKYPIRRGGVIGGVALGIVNILCTSCCLRALSRLSTSLYYPVYNIGIVLVATFAGVLVFKEKIKPIQFVGVLLSILAIFLFFK